MKKILLLLVSLTCIFSPVFAHANTKLEYPAPSWGELASETTDTLFSGVSSISDTASQVAHTVVSTAVSSVSEASTTESSATTEAVDPRATNSGRSSFSGRGSGGTVTRSITGFEFATLDSNFPFKGELQDFSMSASDPRVMYGRIGREVFRTQDSGSSWSRQSLLPYIDPNVPNPDWNTSFHLFASGDTLYASVTYYDTTKLLRSQDGASWQTISLPAHQADFRFISLYVSPQDTTKLLLFHKVISGSEPKLQVSFSSDAGASWTNRSTIDTGTELSFTPVPSSPNSFFLLYNDRFLKTEDFGLTWKNIIDTQAPYYNQMGGTTMRWLKTSAADPNLWILSSSQWNGLGGGSTSVYQSRDAGKQWSYMSQVGITHDRFYNNNYNGSGFLDFAFDPSSRSTLYTTHAFYGGWGNDTGLYRSTDSGTTWSRIDPETHQNYFNWNKIVTTQGKLFSLGRFAVSTNPTDPTSWRFASNGSSTYAEPQKLLVGPALTSGQGASQSSPLVLATTSFGTLKSRDSGVSWSNALPGVTTVGKNNGDGHTYPTDVYPDPLTPGKLYLFAKKQTTTGAGIISLPVLTHQSLDNGTTWTKAAGFSDTGIYSTGINIKISPINSKYMYAYDADRFFYSQDGGLTWQYQGTAPVNFESTYNLIETKNPTTGKFTLLTTTSLWNGSRAVYGGSFSSQDNGKTWNSYQPVANLIGITSARFTVDPKNPAHIFFATWNNGTYTVHESQDGGTSWNKVSETNHTEKFGNQNNANTGIDTAQIQSFLSRHDDRTNQDALVLTLQGQHPIVSKDGGITWNQIVTNLQQNEYWTAISDFSPDGSIYFGQSNGKGISVLRPIKDNTVIVKATLDGRPFDSYTTKTTKLSLPVNFECYIIKLDNGKEVSRTRFSGTGFKSNFSDGTYQLSCTTKTPTDFNGSLYIRNLGLANDATPASELGSKAFTLQGNSQQTVYVDFASIPAGVLGVGQKTAFTATKDGLLWFGTLNANLSTNTNTLSITNVPTLVSTSPNTYTIEAIADGPKGTKLLGVNPHAFSLSELTNQTYNLPFTPAEPTLFVPGVYGTEIVTSENSKIWMDACKEKTPFYENFLRLKYTGLGVNWRPSDATLKPGGVFDDISCFVDGLSKSWPYAGRLKEVFRQQGYLLNSGYYEFAYDWRDGVSYEQGYDPDKSNATLGTVNRLQDLITDCKFEDTKKKFNLTKDSAIDCSLTRNSPTGKVNVIAHSTGGLILKKYLSLNQGTSADPSKNSHVDKIVYLGVPHKGAPKAYNIALTGDPEFNYPVIDKPIFDTSVFKELSYTLPIAYDLSPRSDYSSPTLYTRNNCTVQLGVVYGCDQAQSVGDVTAAQEELWHIGAMDYRGFEQSNLRQAETKDFDPKLSTTQAFSIIGCNQPTLESVTIYKDKAGKVVDLKPAKLNIGDGSVPLQSSEAGKTDPGSNYYTLKAQHGSMPAEKAVSELIFDIFYNTSLHYTADPFGTYTSINDSKCQRPKSSLVEFDSYTSLSVTDESTGENAMIGADRTDAQGTTVLTDSMKESGLSVLHVGNNFYLVIPEAVQARYSLEAENSTYSRSMKGSLLETLQLSSGESIVALYQTNDEGLIIDEPNTITVPETAPIHINLDEQSRITPEQPADQIPQAKEKQLTPPQTDQASTTLQTPTDSTPREQNPGDQSVTLPTPTQVQSQPETQALPETTQSLETSQTEIQDTSTASFLWNIVYPGLFRRDDVSNFEQ